MCEEVMKLMNMLGLGFGMFGLLIWLAFLGLTVYVMILFIQLAQRGIRALDIYIRKNSAEE